MHGYRELRETRTCSSRQCHEEVAERRQWQKVSLITNLQFKTSFRLNYQKIMHCTQFLNSED